MYALNVDAWAEYFASIDAKDARLLATVRLLHHRTAGRPAVAPQPKALRAIRYDRERDVLLVGVGGAPQQPAVRYFISGPRRIVVEECGDAREIVVDDCSHMRTVISVRELPEAPDDGRAPVAQAALS